MRGIIVALALAWSAGWLSHDFIYSCPDVDSEIQNSPAFNPPSSQADVIESSISDQIVSFSEVSIKPLSRLQSFEKLLLKNNFAAALLAWPLDDQKRARDMVLKYGNDLGQAGETATAIRLMNEYYGLFPEDTEVGILYANILHQSQRLHTETFLLMDMLTKTVDKNLFSHIKNQLQNVIHIYSERLMKSGNYRDLLDYYLHLSDLDGNNQEYYLKQVTILIEMGLLEQASVILEPLLFDPGISRRADLLAKKIKMVRSTQYQTSIPLKRSGEHFLVPISINGRAPINLLLDTGASITLIQKRSGEVSKGDNQRHITLQTANGRIRVPIITGNKIILGDYHLPEIELGIMTEPIVNHADGLLGMNILKHFVFFIDQKSLLLKLSLRHIRTE
ncbi:MAG: retropepsin-like aspartic protease [Mariprofundaceae bacterium]